MIIPMREMNPVEKVLIVEDEVVIAKMIADHFISEGFQALTEPDGLSGYQAFEAFPT